MWGSLFPNSDVTGGSQGPVLAEEACQSALYQAASDSLRTVARQAPWPLEFSRPEYWRGLPFPLPGDLPDPGMQSASPALTGGFFIFEPPAKP